MKRCPPASGDVIDFTARMHHVGFRDAVKGMLPRGNLGRAMLKRLPKILRFIPGTAQDVRAYFITLQYWLAGSDDNVANMIRMLIDRYADGPRRVLRGAFKVAPPMEYPEMGVYHPRMKGRIGEEFDGIISSVSSFGAFVMLDNTAEGLVHVTAMSDDYYRFDAERFLLWGENNGKQWRLGQSVRVRIVDVALADRRIEMEWA